MAYHTAMQFTYIEFDKNWDRGGTVVYIALTTNAQLLVVSEGATGTKTTYAFKVARNEQVYVSYETNVVFIPARCIRSVRGDKTECAPK